MMYNFENTSISTKFKKKLRPVFDRLTSTCFFFQMGLYNGGQKISSTIVIPRTYAVKQPLGTNNLTSHVDICRSNCV
jgi:hypothetical protein